MRGVAVVVGLAAIGFAVYRSHHRKGFLFTVKAVRRSEIPRGAIVTPDSLKGKVALKNIPAGAELEQADTRPSHHCFSGPMDAAGLRHHPTYLCKLPQ